MTITLCIETSGAHCSLALAQEAHIYASQHNLERRHNQELLPLLEDLFCQAQLRPTDVQLVAFGAGPGSFTGVRIAASACQAIALAADARVLPVRSSWVLAATAAKTLPGPKRLVTSLPSRGDAYYLAGAVIEDGALSFLHADALTDELPDWVATFLAVPDSHIVGACPGWLPAELQDRFVADLTPTAQFMVSYARREHEAGRSLPVEHALPVYIDGDSPWRKQRPAPNL